MTTRVAWVNWRSRHRTVGGELRRKTARKPAADRAERPALPFRPLEDETELAALTLVAFRDLGADLRQQAGQPAGGGNVVVAPAGQVLHRKPDLRLVRRRERIDVAPAAGQEHGVDGGG